jgi:PAS domain S-box-containing protein
MFLFCSLPIILNWLGISFSSPVAHVESYALDGSAIVREELIYALAGDFHHALLEWSAVTIALISAFICLVHYKTYHAIYVAILGLAFFIAGLIDAFDTLVATRVIGNDTPIANFVPFTWAISRLFTSVIVVVAVLTSIWLARQSASINAKLARRTLFITGILFPLVAVLVMYTVLNLEQLPKTVNPGALISRPYDLIPLAIFVMSATLVWNWNRQLNSRSSVRRALLISFIPLIMAQTHMAFGSTQLFDNNFNIAHFLKVVAYLTVLVGLLSDFKVRNEAKVLPTHKRESEPDKNFISDKLLEIGKAKWPLSLRLPAIAFLMALILTGIIGSLFYTETVRVVTEKNQQFLAEKNRQIKTVITVVYKEMFDHLNFIRRFPAIETINDQLKLDSFADTSSEMAELTQLSSNFLTNRIIYTGIRYFDIKSRTNLFQLTKNNNKLSTNDEKKAMIGQSLPFFEQLNTGTKNTILFSEIMPTQQPDLRGFSQKFEVALPIFSSDNHDLERLLIVEVNFDRFMQLIEMLALKDIDLFIENSSHRLIYHPRRLSHFKKKNTSLSGVFSEMPLPGQRISESNQAKAINFVEVSNPDISKNKTWSLYQEFQDTTFGKGHRFTWLILPTDNKLIGELREIEYRSIILSLGLAFIALALSLFGARKIAAPLSKMTEIVSKNHTKNVLNELPIKSSDEIGVLARGFYNLQIQKLFKDREVEEHQFALDQHAIVVATNVNGDIIFVNSKFEAISGYQSSELLGKKYEMLYSKDQEKSYFAAMYQELSLGNVWRSEISNRSKDGNVYWLDTSVVPFIKDNGDIYQYISICTDITDQKNSEQALINEKQRMELIISSASVGIWDWNLDSGEMTVNERWANMLGYSRAELAPISNQTWNRLCFSADVIKSNKALEKHWNEVTEHYQCETRMRHKDGHTMWIMDTGKVVAWNNKNKPIRMIGTQLDISKTKMDEIRLIDAKEKAEKAMLAKSEFFASMSHEIRTPMNGVLGMLGLIMGTQLDERQQHYTSLARSSAVSLLSIIDDILDISKIEAGKIQIEKVPFDLIEMMGNFAESTAYRAQQKNIELILDMTEVNLNMVVADVHRIRQVLSNLVGNAIKFTESGEINIAVFLNKNNERKWVLHCDVSDTGHGIAKENIDKLFDSYSQIDSSTTRKFGGTGLGLAIVKQLVGLMEGSVSATSKIGYGSTFSFELKVEVEQEEVNDKLSHRGEKQNILIVDDNENARKVLDKQLAKWGAKTTVASSGKRALELLQEYQSGTTTTGRAELAESQQSISSFSLVLIDMNMKPMDGLQLARIIRQEQSYDNIHLVMMTSMEGSRDFYKIRDIRNMTYFPKPATSVDLLRTLQWEELEHPSFSLESAKEGSSKQKFFDTKILLVEDNPINQEVALGILTDMGIEVEVAEDGLEAYNIMASGEKTFDLVLMDCQMPILDGYQSTEKIRLYEVENLIDPTPIIALTANALRGDKQNCINAGMNDYLSKPVDPILLESKIISFLPSEKYRISLKQETNTKTLRISAHEKNKTDRKIALRDDTSDSSELREPKMEGELPLSESNKPEDWDKQGLMARVRGNEKLAAKLVDLFRTDLPGLREHLKLSIEEDMLVDVIAHSHRIKGSAANLSADKVSSIAATIEKRARLGDLQGVKLCMNEFDSSVEELMKLLNSDI